MAESRTLEILLKLKDDASSGIKSLSDQIKKTEPDFKAAAIAGTAAFAAISLAVKGSIDAAIESEQVQSQLASVLRSTGYAAGVTSEEAIRLSKALQQTTSFGDEAVLSAENLLLTFTNIGSDIFPQATETVLNMSVALGQDLKSSAIQLGKALQDPIEGVSALRRVGVNFNEAQQEVIKNLVETGHAAEAQKLIMAELAKEFGGSATNEAKTFGGQMKQLKEQVGEVAESVGKALLPDLSKLVSAITPVISKLANWIEENPTLTKTIVAVSLGLTGFVAATISLSVALPTLIGLVKALGIAISTGLGPIMMIASGLTILAGVISNQLNKPYEESIARNEAFTKKLGELGDQSRELKSKLADMGSGFKQVGEDARKAAEDVAKMEKAIQNTIKEGNERQAGISQNIGDAIVEQQQRVADLEVDIHDKKNEIKKAQRDKDSSDQVDKLQQELAELQSNLSTEQAALQSHNDLILQYNGQVVEAKRRAAETEFERKLEDLLKERALELQRTLQKLQDQKAELEALKVTLAEKQKIYQQDYVNFAKSQDDILQKLKDNLAEQKKLLKAGSGADSGITQSVSGNFANSTVAVIGKRAAGGPVSSGSTYLVGERGAELFRPSVSGSIIPNNQLGGGGMNVSVVVNGDVSGQDLVDKVTKAIMGNINMRQRYVG